LSVSFSVSGIGKSTGSCWVYYDVSSHACDVV